LNEPTPGAPNVNVQKLRFCYRPESSSPVSSSGRILSQFRLVYNATTYFPKIVFNMPSHLYFVFASGLFPVALPTFPHHSTFATHLNLHELVTITVLKILMYLFNISNSISKYRVIENFIRHSKHFSVSSD
jgi:hypothetical protein